MQDNTVEGKNSTEWNTESEHIHCDCEILQFIKWIGERHVQKRRQQRINCKYLEYLCSEREGGGKWRGRMRKCTENAVLCTTCIFSLSLSHSLAPSLHTNRAHINLYGFFHFTFCFVSFRIVFSVFRILYDHALLLRSLSLSFFSV